VQATRGLQGPNRPDETSEAGHRVASRDQTLGMISEYQQRYHTRGCGAAINFRTENSIAIDKWLSPPSIFVFAAARVAPFTALDARSQLRRILSVSGEMLLAEK
jgi:hypothetical protein